MDCTREPRAQAASKPGPPQRTRKPPRRKLGAELGRDMRSGEPVGETIMPKPCSGQPKLCGGRSGPGGPARASAATVKDTRAQPAMKAAASAGPLPDGIQDPLWGMRVHGIPACTTSWHGTGEPGTRQPRRQPCCLGRRLQGGRAGQGRAEAAPAGVPSTLAGCTLVTTEMQASLPCKL